MYKLITICVLAICGNIPPSNQQDQIGVQTDVANRGSFLTIVTPDPIDESSRSTPSSQTLVRNSIECFCIPYNYCYPNDTIRPDATVDFRTVDVKYNSESCLGVLDRCCRRENQLMQQIQSSPPPPPPPPPTPVSVRHQKPNRWMRYPNYWRHWY